MDATSEQARVIAALCGITPESAAQPIIKHELRNLENGYGFYQTPVDNEGIATLDFTQLDGVHHRAWIKIDTAGKIKLKAGGSLKFGCFYPLNEMFEAISKSCGLKKSPQYLQVLRERFAVANDLLASEVV